MPKVNRLEQVRDLVVMLQAMHKSAGEEKFLENLSRLADPDDASLQRGMSAAAFTASWGVPVSVAELLLDFQAFNDILQDNDIDIRGYFATLLAIGDDELLDYDMRKTDIEWVKKQFLPAYSAA